MSGQGLPGRTTPRPSSINSAELPTLRLVCVGHDGMARANRSRIKGILGSLPANWSGGRRPDAGRGAPLAQPPATETTVQKNLVETFEDAIPTCKDGGRSTPSRPPVIPSSTPTTVDDGRIHATFTRTDTFVAVPLEEPSLPSYTGKFTGRVQPERQDGEWHLHLHYARYRLRRIDVQEPHDRPLHPAARRLPLWLRAAGRL